MGTASQFLQCKWVSCRKSCWHGYPALAMRPQCFSPTSQKHTHSLSAGVSRPYLPPAPNKATKTVVFFFGKMLAPAGKQQQAAASSSKQQQAEAASSSKQQAAATAGKQVGKQAVGTHQYPMIVGETLTKNGWHFHVFFISFFHMWQWKSKPCTPLSSHQFSCCRKGSSLSSS